MNTDVLSSETTRTQQADGHSTTIHIGADCHLTLDTIQALISQPATVQFSDASLPRMAASYQYLKSCVDQRLPVYGVNTNFGDQVSFIDLHLNAGEDIYYQAIRTRQIEIVRSLTCGLGEVTSAPIVKTTMVLRAHCLAQGYSGVTQPTMDAMLRYINSGITPAVRRYGSIGASGDLIPLSTIAAGLCGENVDVLYRGESMRATDALRKANLEKAVFELRDGLAMINGTSFMTAITATTLIDLRRLFKQMLSAVAMALESMMVITSGYKPLVHQLKRQAGQQVVSEYLMKFWEKSQLLTCLDELRAHAREHYGTDKQSVKAMQDYYSLRSVPQGFGPFYENLQQAITWVENEMNSVNDNPIIDTETGHVHHNANFMGYYITDACDLLKMDIAQASTWVHALLANLIHARKNAGLTTNLACDPARNNGFRSMQLLAAALAVQNRKLAQSHQAYMLPTEGDNQDVNSLGTHAAFDLQESVRNLERLTSILFLAASQALDLRGIEKAGDRSRQIHQSIRQRSPKIVECRPMTHEMEAIIDMMQQSLI